MNVTVTPEPVQRPPLTVTITLCREEAEELLELLGNIGCGGSENRIQGPKCDPIPEPDRAKDRLYGGHSWKYKRVVDTLFHHLSKAFNPHR